MGGRWLPGAVETLTRGTATAEAWEARAWSEQRSHSGPKIAGASAALDEETKPAGGLSGDVAEFRVISTTTRLRLAVEQAAARNVCWVISSRQSRCGKAGRGRSRSSWAVPRLYSTGRGGSPGFCWTMSATPQSPSSKWRKGKARIVRDSGLVVDFPPWAFL